MEWGRVMMYKTINLNNSGRELGVLTGLIVLKKKEVRG